MQVRIEITDDGGTLLEEYTFPAFAVTNRLDSEAGPKDADGRELLGFVFAPKMRTSDGTVLIPTVNYPK